MRILAIQDYLRVGGTEAQFLDLTARWLARGHEVGRLVFRRGGPLFSESLQRGPRPDFLQPLPTPWNWWSPGLRKRIQKMNPDRVICFGRNAHWSLARSCPQREYPGLVATVRTGRPLPRGYRRLLGGAERVVTNSAFARELALGQGSAPDRTTVIENGCRLAGIPFPDRVEARCELGVAEEESVVLVMGSFVPGKSQGRVLSVWNRLAREERSRLQLWFVGDGPCRGRLEKEAKRLPGADRIRFWGNLPTVEGFLAAADGLVSMSREESSPNVLVEGLCAGVPIAATSCAGVRELVAPESGGRVAADSPEGEEQIREWIRTLPEEAASRRERAVAYSRKAATRFDPEKRAEDYLEILAQMEKFELRKR